MGTIVDTFKLCSGMSDSESGEESGEEALFYRDRPDWQDVTPVPQDDGPNPPVQIAYSDRFKDVFDYLRAMLKKDERSERAFKLTKDALSLNAATYTVWQYRRVLVKELKVDLKEELRYVTQQINKHPKNYQVWHHRKVIVEWLGDSSEELDFVASILKQDAKNYHAWQHRQWVLSYFSLWENELNYVSRLLAEDFRNNSAWNQRYFVISNTSKLTEEVITREIQYTLGIIRKAPNNESAWSYLRGILLDTEMRQFPVIADFCKELYADNIRSPFLLGFLIELAEEELELGCENHVEILHNAKQLCTDLAEEFDTIRYEYWAYIRDTLQEKYNTENS